MKMTKQTIFHMKKSLTIIAAASFVFSLSACSQPSVEEKTEKFNAQCEQIISDFQNQVAEVQQDSTLAADQIREKCNELYEGAIGDLTDLGIKTLKKNKNNELGVTAFTTICNYVESDEELETLIGTLSEENQANEAVSKVNTALQTRKKVAVGMPFVDFEVNGVKLSDYVGKGKYILVDFWASWCGPCKAEIPNIKDIYDTYHGDDFDVLSVAVWDKVEDTIATAKEHGVVWNQIVDAQRIPSDAYGFNSIPQLFLFGPDGTILAKGEDLRGENMKKTVAAALGR